MLVHQEYQRALHVFEEWLEQEQATLASISHPDGNVETLEKTLEQLQVLVLCGVSTCWVCHKWITYNYTNRLSVWLLFFSILLSPTASTGGLLKWTVSAVLCANQQRESNPMGCTSDWRSSVRHCSAGMGSLPGPSGRDTVSAPFHTGKAETDRPKVSEPGPVAGGDGESGKYQTQPSIGQSNEGDSAEKTPGQSNKVRRFKRGVMVTFHSQSTCLYRRANRNFW